MDYSVIAGKKYSALIHFAAPSFKVAPEKRKDKFFFIAAKKQR
jgi:hypothetical protein